MSKETLSPWVESAVSFPLARSTTHHPWLIVESTHLMPRTAIDRASPSLTERFQPSGSPSSFCSLTPPASGWRRCRLVTSRSVPVRVMTVSPYVPT